MKTIKELDEELRKNGDKTYEQGQYWALKDVVKVIDEVIKKHIHMHYHSGQSCPQAIRKELKERIEG